MHLSDTPLITAETIQGRVKEVAAEIRSRTTTDELVLVVVLKGAAIFAADLMRYLKMDVTLDFIRVRSYAGTTSTGNIEVLYEPELPVMGKNVLLVEDILDTGRTARVLIARLEKQRPASLAICALLDKPSQREVNVVSDYAGFEIDNHFVVGYGLDYDERYRNLPDIWTLEEG